MKLKKGLIVTIISISILVLTFSTNSFAMSLRSKMRSRSLNENSNSIENQINNEIENNTKNEVNNETKNNIKNEVNNETKNNIKNEVNNETKNNIKNEINNETENSSSSNKSTKTTTKKEVINKDLSIFETTDELEYENVKINGNVFIASSNNITLNNLEVNGDVMLLTTENSKIINSEINGSVYIVSGNVVIKDSILLSLYSVGNDLKIDNGTEITRELKLIGDVITFDGEVGRNFVAIGGKVKIDDNGKVDGETIIKSEEKRISELADIDDLDYDEIFYAKSDYEEDTSEKVGMYLIEKGIEIVVILAISIFLLCGFPKFVKVNSNVKLGNFVVDFFFGLLMFIICLAIVAGLLITGYGIGYGLILLNLLFIFVILGKVLFVISFAIRFTCSSGNVSKVKVFLGTILVSIVLALIGMISLAGNVGAIINFAISVILAFTGFGAMFRVIFASKKKYENKLVDNLKDKNEVKQEEKQIVSESKLDKNVEQEDLKKEIKEEVRQEIEELKEERKLENEIIEENKETNGNNDENNKENEE